MNYYLLKDDMWDDGSSERWIFNNIKYGRGGSNYDFIDPPVEYMEPCTYPVDLYRDGASTDFSFTMDSGNIPILSEKARTALLGLPEVDEPYKNVVLEPVIIDNKIVDNNYYIMIIETQIDCVDESRSEFCKFKENDSIRPDLAGEYSEFTNLVIDPTKVGDFHIFRIKKSLGSIVVSEEVKRRFEEAGVTGVVFASVNGDCQTMA